MWTCAGSSFIRSDPFRDRLRGEPIQPVSGPVAGAAGFEVDGAVAFHAGPAKGATNGAGDGVDGVAQAEFEFLSNFHPVFGGEVNELPFRIQLAQLKASLQIAGLSVARGFLQAGQGADFGAFVDF